MQVQIAGMPWFAADDYEAFRRLMPERSWHPTFAEWEKAANEGLKRIERSGARAVKAHVRSQDFARWCRETGRDINTQALLDFANEAAIRAFHDSNLQ